MAGRLSHELHFSHPQVGNLTVHTGADSIAWGYVLNTANYPTYGGEVVQILSCYVDNLTVEGTLRTLDEMENLHRYFYSYLQTATQGKKADPVPGQSSYNESPMTLEYPHRGWTFQIIPTNVPGFRVGREVVAPQWSIECFIVDSGDPNESGDVNELKDLIIDEASMKLALDSDDPAFSESFGLEGKIRFMDNNPFSDPSANVGTGVGKDAKYDPTTNLQALGDHYAKLLPAYLAGDYDTIFKGLGSKPAFSSKKGPKGTTDKAVAKAQADATTVFDQIVKTEKTK